MMRNPSQNAAPPYPVLRERYVPNGAALVGMFAAVALAGSGDAPRGNEAWAALIESERQEAEARRQRRHRNWTLFLAGLLGIVLIVGTRLLLH